MSFELYQMSHIPGLNHDCFTRYVSKSLRAVLKPREPPSSSLSSLETQGDLPGWCSGFRQPLQQGREMRKSISPGSLFLCAVSSLSLFLRALASVCYSDLLSSTGSLRAPELSLRDRTDGPAACGGGLCRAVLPLWFVWIPVIPTCSRKKGWVEGGQIAEKSIHIRHGRSCYTLLCGGDPEEFVNRPETEPPFKVHSTSPPMSTDECQLARLSMSRREGTVHTEA